MSTRIVLVLLLLITCTVRHASATMGRHGFASGNHTNNWAVLVCTSRYWFNYRHFANTLSLYRTVKRLGIPDSHIILMLPDDMACNPRNPFPGQLLNHHKLDLYGDHVQVDYRGDQVTVENFIRVLTGRHGAAVPLSQQLLSDASSNVLVYLSGHGGEGFLKFQGSEEMMSHDLSGAISQMHEAGRYNELLLIVDTCQASSLMDPLTAPNVLPMVSSKTGESSYSYYTDAEVGLSVIDRFSYFLLSFLEQVNINSKTTLQQLVNNLRSQRIGSTFCLRTDLFSRPLSTAMITDFFGSVKKAAPVYKAYGPLKPTAAAGKGEREGPRTVPQHGSSGTVPQYHQLTSDASSHMSLEPMVCTPGPSHTCQTHPGDSSEAYGSTKAYGSGSSDGGPSVPVQGPHTSGGYTPLLDMAFGSTLPWGVASDAGP